MAKRRFLDDVPGVKAPRANFNLSHRVATTMKPGLLHPIDIVEVLPGDTWTVDSAQLVKLSTPLIRPIMDDVYLDTYSFFVPLRLTYDQLENVFGNSSPSSYEEVDLAEIPKFPIVLSNGAGFNMPPSGGVMDYLGYPSTISVSESLKGLNSYYSILPVRAFALIWNEFFRNQQVDQECNVNLTSVVAQSELPNVNAWGPTNYSGKLPPVRRYGDYFSTALLAPQKGPAVKIPINGAPVISAGSTHLHGGRMLFSDSSNVLISGDLKMVEGQVVSQTDTVAPGSYIAGSNMVVDDGGTINALRTAFQLQKYLERDAFYGSRYREYLYSAFGVMSQDSRMQVPEFLGGTHNRLQVSQIMSTANTSDVAQGQFSGQISSLSEKNLKFSKSIPEHGYIITVACIRYKHLYSQAVQKLFFRFDREDFYDKLFSNLGQQAINSNQLLGGGSETHPIIGYQEAYAEYRTILDRVTGQMRPESGNLGQFWSLADRFDSVPSLVDLVHEQTDSFNRVLAATTDTQDPFVVDFNFRCSVARVVSPYSMPGYADHH
nr:major head protein [Microvirus sp.]